MGSSIDVKFRDYDVYKLVVCGPGESGKTSICKRIIENKFLKQYNPTVGAEFHSFAFRKSKEKAVALFYDMAGQDRFKVVRNLFYPGTKAVAIVFDVSKRESFREVANWIREVRKNLVDLDITIVGNKSDLIREINRDDAERIFEKLGCKYLETSAKTGEGIGDLLKNMVGSAINFSKIRTYAE